MTDPTMLYIDLDGVIVDWCRGALRLLDLPLDLYWELDNWDALDPIIGRDTLWNAIDEAGPDFWANLEALPMGLVLLTEVLTRKLPFVFVTAPSRHSSSAAGKVEWLANHLPHDMYGDKPLHRRFALCPAKHLIAHPGAVLVDDRVRNVRKFQEAGGRAVLWPQPWNTVTEHRDNTNLPLELCEMQSAAIDKVLLEFGIDRRAA